MTIEEEIKRKMAEEAGVDYDDLPDDLDEVIEKAMAALLPHMDEDGTLVVPVPVNDEGAISILRTPEEKAIEAFAFITSTMRNIAEYMPDDATEDDYQTELGRFLTVFGKQMSIYLDIKGASAPSGARTERKNDWNPMFG